MTVTDWFLSGNSSRQIEHIQAGEYELDAAEVAGLVEALAACAAQPDSGIGASSLAGIAGNYWDVV